MSQKAHRYFDLFAGFVPAQHQGQSDLSEYLHLEESGKKAAAKREFGNIS